MPNYYISNLLKLGRTKIHFELPYSAALSVSEWYRRNSCIIFNTVMCDLVVVRTTDFQNSVPLGQPDILARSKTLMKMCQTCLDLHHLDINFTNFPRTLILTILYPLHFLGSRNFGQPWIDLGQPSLKRSHQRTTTWRKISHSLSWICHGYILGISWIYQGYILGR